MAKRQTHHIGDLKSMFGRLEELILANSGEDEFEEIFKLLIAKIWDEKTNDGKVFHAYPTSAETSKMVCSLLNDASKAWPGILPRFCLPSLTAEHLQVCVEALSQHQISGFGFEVMDDFFEFLVARGAKGAKGQYFTPRYVIEFCVRMLQPRSDESVADPACGSGGFLFQTLNYVRQSEKLDAGAIRRYAEEKIWGFDIDSRALRVAKALMILSGNAGANMTRLNSLLTPSIEGTLPLTSDEESSALTIEDICRTRLRHHKGFDLILTNPPFAGEVREANLLNQYAIANQRNRIERDILFIERCVNLLRPGGRMAIVLPHNKLAAESYTFVREWLRRKVQILAVVGLGRNTFLPHTHQKVGILFARKYLPGEAPAPRDEIFFGVSEQEGKNSKGQIIERAGSHNGSPWERVHHDLSPLVDEFHSFRADAQIGLTKGGEAN